MFSLRLQTNTNGDMDATNSDSSYHSNSNNNMLSLSALGTFPFSDQSATAEGMYLISTKLQLRVSTCSLLNSHSSLCTVPLY